jgi:hypothetical protein
MSSTREPRMAVWVTGAVNHLSMQDAILWRAVPTHGSVGAAIQLKGQGFVLDLRDTAYRQSQLHEQRTGTANG